jgi:hypothetical protein
MHAASEADAAGIERSVSIDERSDAVDLASSRITTVELLLRFGWICDPARRSAVAR